MFGIALSKIDVHVDGKQGFLYDLMAHRADTCVVKLNKLWKIKYLFDVYNRFSV